MQERIDNLCDQLRNKEGTPAKEFAANLQKFIEAQGNNALSEGDKEGFDNAFKSAFANIGDSDTALQKIKIMYDLKDYFLNERVFQAAGQEAGQQINVERIEQVQLQEDVLPDALKARILGNAEAAIQPNLANGSANEDAQGGGGDNAGSDTNADTHSDGGGGAADGAAGGGGDNAGGGTGDGAAGGGDNAGGGGDRPQQGRAVAPEQREAAQQAQQNIIQGAAGQEAAAQNLGQRAAEGQVAAQVLQGRVDGAPIPQPQVEGQIPQPRAPQVQIEGAQAPRGQADIAGNAQPLSQGDGQLPQAGGQGQLGAQQGAAQVQHAAAGQAQGAPLGQPQAPVAAVPQQAAEPQAQPAIAEVERPNAPTAEQDQAAQAAREAEAQSRRVQEAAERAETAAREAEAQRAEAAETAQREAAAQQEAAREAEEANRVAAAQQQAAERAEATAQQISAEEEASATAIKEGIEATIDQTQNELAATRRTITERSSEIDDLNAEIDDFQDLLTTSQFELINATEEATKAQQDLAALEAQGDGADPAELEAARVRNADAQRNLEDAKAAFNQNAEQVRTGQERLTQLQQQQEQAKTQAQSQQARIDRLNTLSSAVNVNNYQLVSTLHQNPDAAIANLDNQPENQQIVAARESAQRESAAEASAAQAAAEAQQRSNQAQERAAQAQENLIRATERATARRETARLARTALDRTNAVEGAANTVVERSNQHAQAVQDAQIAGQQAQMQQARAQQATAAAQAATQQAVAQAEIARQAAEVVGQEAEAVDQATEEQQRTTQQLEAAAAQLEQVTQEENAQVEQVRTNITEDREAAAANIARNEEAMRVNEGAMAELREEIEENRGRHNVLMTNALQARQEVEAAQAALAVPEGQQVPEGALEKLQQAQAKLQQAKAAENENSTSFQQLQESLNGYNERQTALQQEISGATNYIQRLNTLEGALDIGNYERIAELHQNPQAVLDNLGTAQPNQRISNAQELVESRATAQSEAAGSAEQARERLVAAQNRAAAAQSNFEAARLQAEQLGNVAAGAQQNAAQAVQVAQAQAQTAIEAQENVLRAQRELEDARVQAADALQAAGLAVQAADRAEEELVAAQDAADSVPQDQAPEDPAAQGDQRLNIPPVESELTPELSAAVQAYEAAFDDIERSDTDEEADTIALCNALLRAAGSSLKYESLGEDYQGALRSIVDRYKVKDDMSTNLPKAASALLEQAYYGFRDIDDLPDYVRQNETNRKGVNDFFESRNTDMNAFDAKIKGALQHELNQHGKGALNWVRGFFENRVAGFQRFDDWITHKMSNSPIKSAATVSTLILIGMMFLPGGFATGLMIFALITGTTAIASLGTKFAKTLPGHVLFSLPALALDGAMGAARGVAYGLAGVWSLLTGKPFAESKKAIDKAFGDPLKYTTKLWDFGKPVPGVKYSVDEYANNAVKNTKDKEIEKIVSILRSIYDPNSPERYHTELAKLAGLKPLLVATTKFTNALVGLPTVADARNAAASQAAARTQEQVEQHQAGVATRQPQQAIPGQIIPPVIPAIPGQAAPHQPVQVVQPVPVVPHPVQVALQGQQAVQVAPVVPQQGDVAQQQGGRPQMPLPQQLGQPAAVVPQGQQAVQGVPVVPQNVLQEAAVHIAVVQGGGNHQNVDPARRRDEEQAQHQGR